MKSAFPRLLLLCACAGCAVGPDYERPDDLPVPPVYRGQVLGPEPPEDLGLSFGDLEWAEVFRDPVLQELIEVALRDNQDVRIAAERVLQARSFVTIDSSGLWPDINAGADYRSMRVTENGPVPLGGVDTDQEQVSLFADLSWELDFWGRFRRASEAARADLLATQYARRAVIQSLVTEVALAYFDLLLLDEQLEITRQTQASRERSFELVSLRLDEGVANKVEYRQAESLVMETARLVPEFELLIEQQENLIRFLIGSNPGPIARGTALREQDRSLELPLGLPSDLLERRPDVCQAEEELIAANARIGEARALLYPSIRLTALGGAASEELHDLFNASSGIWDIGPSVNLPIFNAGRLRANVDVTESRQREAVLNYTQILQRAFREVADGLIGHTKRIEVRGWLERLEEVLSDQVSLSRDRYQGGVTSYLEVLDSERDRFDAALSLANSVRDELSSYVLLYRALGGGWVGAELLAAGEPEVETD